ncbi:MAG: LacI family DNA-binding transcriptional regulator [Sphingobacteriales bacterium]|uniref:LacI family DNA-binding transcriptional regulator n=1 Tax=Hydrotalea flava TaxID=714549 RepID=UPI00082F1830|nr:LacI family DNA-binding transcriptional regulator [Hydrotalea flava]RTL55092.1 MAG: LacI family DNA-binding transcriptional regulator [Sphingobacteriales bacterium]
MQQTSTLKQLAQILNMSISTVSRALKNHPDIAEKTKQKVRELAASLEYEPNAYAIQLRTNVSNVLGIMIPTITNFFYDTFIASVEEEARKAGYSLLIMQSGESSEVEQNNLKLLKKNRVSGLFVSVTKENNDISAFEKLEEQNIPVVYIDRVPHHENCNKICLADTESATLAAYALIEHQKKNVLALFGYPNLSITEKRLEAFIHTFQTFAPAAIVNCRFPDQTKAAKKETLHFLNSKNIPDAIFCMGDQILMGVMQALYEKKIKIPEQTAVISISNGFIPTLFQPNITYIETSGKKLGKYAFKRMMECLHGDKTFKEILVPSILVSGNSL